MTDDWTDGKGDTDPDIMSDITKCTNGQCVIRHGCRRWTAPADPLWQAYQRFEPFHNGDYYGCNHYIPDHRNHPVTDGESPSKSRELE
jgi:hypothetical protein